jgi:hypothetical protein
LTFCQARATEEEEEKSEIIFRMETEQRPEKRDGKNVAHFLLLISACLELIIDSLKSGIVAGALLGRRGKIDHGVEHQIDS